MYLVIEYAFVGALVFDNPVLQPMFRDSLETFDFNPYVFLYDVALWTIDAAAEPTSESRDQLTSVLAYMEEGMASRDFGLWNLVAAGFLHGMPSKGKRGSELHDLVGPLCRAQLERSGYLDVWPDKSSV